MTIRVSGGILNSQSLTGGMRFFKIVGPFAWAVSDGTVNLPVLVHGGPGAGTTWYFQVGNGCPVPNSAAELALKTVIEKSDIIVIGMTPGLAGTTTEIDIAVSASAFGWGSDYPDYQVAPANADEDQLPTTPTHAAIELQAAIRALPAATVYITVGAADQTLPPVTAVANFAAVTVTEVSFSLGSLTYYNLS
jgi:hypothetical protein